MDVTYTTSTTDDTIQMDTRTTGRRNGRAAASTPITNVHSTSSSASKSIPSPPKINVPPEGPDIAQQIIIMKDLLAAIKVNLIVSTQTHTTRIVRHSHTMQRLLTPNTQTQASTHVQKEPERDNLHFADLHPGKKAQQVVQAINKENLRQQHGFQNSEASKYTHSLTHTLHTHTHTHTHTNTHKGARIR